MQKHDADVLRSFNSQYPWDGMLPLTIILECYHLHGDMAFQVGRCDADVKQPAPATQGEPQPMFWATIVQTDETLFYNNSKHNCSADHILAWPDLEKCFKLRSREHGDVFVTLLFSREPSLHSAGCLTLKSFTMEWK